VSRRAAFDAIRSEGALLPPDLMQRIAERDKELGGLRGEDYGLPPNEPLNEAIVRSYNRMIGAWGSFQEARAKLPEGDPGTSITRDRLLLVLLHELGYGRVETEHAIEIEGRSYPVSHAWRQVPIHLLGCNVPLGTRSKGVAGASSQSPHGVLQELLNRSEERLWGIVSNGLELRLLRDNSSLTRQAFVSFDLEQMLEGDVYSDFALLWMLCHASRVEGERPHECWLERWSQEAQKQGTRALEGLRTGVEEAISALGSGFLRPGRNAELKSALRAGDLSTQDYYRELLRLVYRLLFLFVAEDRKLLHYPEASEEAKERYAEWYSSARLRRLAERRRGTKHGDLWESLSLVMRSLGKDEGEPALGLPALGSFLWSRKATAHLQGASLPNGALLEAVRSLATVRDGRVLRSVDYKNLGAEELGSVYESLLELHPELDLDTGTFGLTTAAGNERKTTGSYYTPSSLISCLLDSALDPVLEDAAAKGKEAILDLKVCDPACGSGHFLVAAAHRIAKRLASLRTGDEEPSPEATRAALRDVVSRCIYGVDVNPMAVELCKVSLWMEALDPGRPLSFLDAHIKCGNSLLGTTAAFTAEGVPEEAFKALEGDDKEIAKALRRQNRSEREGQLTFEDLASGLVQSLEREAQELEGAADDTPEMLREKEQRFKALGASESFVRARLSMDAWCAAFVQRKVAGAPPITSGVARRIASGYEQSEVADEVRRLAREYGFFQWEVEFPQVFARESGGFDVVLGNPPWERVKLQEKEFFGGHEEIAGARNAAARKKLIAGLEEEDPALYMSWLAALRKADGESHLARTTGRYPLCGRGDINTYSIFAELMRSLLSTRGRVGCIVPTGIATDATTQFFFRDLIHTGTLVSLFGFENEAFIFPAIHHALKFCLLTAGGAGTVIDSADFVFFARAVTDLAQEERHFTLSGGDISLLNPNTRTCPTFRSRRDAEITIGIHRRMPVLIHEGDASGNPWGISFMSMFHMANDSGLFQDAANPHTFALYEGKMIHLFDHRFGTYEGQTEAQAAQGKLPELTDNEHANPDLAIQPRYWVDEKLVNDALQGRWDRDWFLAFRDMTSSVTVRTFVVSAIPRTAVGHKLPLLLPASGKASHLLGLLGSFVFDFAARQKIGGTSMTFFVVNQLPVLGPDIYRKVASFADETLGDWVEDRVLELVYTAWDIESFAREHGYDGPPFRWDPERRALLRAELDAALFHAYGLERDDVDYVMDTFWVVRDRDVKAHGEYRTKRVILEIYDELAEAIATGRPYLTRLDPPPADPLVAHGAADNRAAADGDRRQSSPLPAAP
jgi:N-6 DNA Methylase